MGHPVVLDVHKNMKNTPPNFKNLQEELKIMSSRWDQAFLRGQRRGDFRWEWGRVRRERKGVSLLSLSPFSLLFFSPPPPPQKGLTLRLEFIPVIPTLFILLYRHFTR